MWTDRSVGAASVDVETGWVDGRGSVDVAVVRVAGFGRGSGGWVGWRGMGALAGTVDWEGSGARTGVPAVDRTLSILASVWDRVGRAG